MSLWDLSADALLAKTASDAPTPGGGSIACVAGALGVGLVAMAIEVTRRTATSPELDEIATTLAEQVAALKSAADEDVGAFEAYMAVLSMPRATDEEKASRKASMSVAASRAAAVPLAAAQRMLAAMLVAERAAGLAKKNIVSDVLAGADLVHGAAIAALRSVDINVPQLAEPKRTEVAASRSDVARDLEAAYARVLALR